MERTDLRNRKSDPLPLIAEGIERYNRFEEEQRARMRDDGIISYFVQRSFLTAGELILRFPFDGILTFHVREGLMEFGGRILLDKEDGGCYWLKRNPLTSQDSEELEFKGCIRRAEDIDLLIEKIKQKYELEV